MPAAPFGAVLTAMVTPFDEVGALDLDAAAALARWLVEHGSDGLVVAGTTGEGPVLDDTEKLDLFAAVAEAVTVPVIGGTASNDTAHSIELTRRASSTGLDGVLVVTPYYNRPSQAGLAAHFEAVAGATALRVCLYDIPVRTGRRIAPDTMLGVARRCANVVAVKDATSDVVGAAGLIAQAPAGFALYSGEDAVTLPLLSIGAVGVISVASHWVGPQMAAMIEAFGAGRVAEARVRNAELGPSFAFESSEEFPNPLPAKAACRALGLAVGQCRAPMGSAPEVLDERARQLVERTGAPSAQPVG